MSLQHYDQKTKHILPGASANDILYYNGDTVETTTSLPVLGVTTFTGTTATITTGTIATFAATGTMALFGHAAAGQQAVINAVALTANYTNEYANINTTINLIITKLKNLGLTA